MSVLTRFAPSPTGLLHVGNARTALFNWLFARQRGGSMALRLDDTDRERSQAEYAAAIAEDLAWLGLDWSRLERQSERFRLYEAARERLAAAGRLYPCYETPEELAEKREAQRARGRPPVYDRAALKLSDADRAAYEEAGRRPHWRFLLDDRAVAWDDLIRGPVRFEAGHLSDPVLVRSDGDPTYTLASVVDDADLGITHVIRGEDHVANTAVQIQLFEGLGSGVPAFGHHPLLTDVGGAGLSKRLGSLTLRRLREDGIEPLAIVSLLVRLGTADPVEPMTSLDEAVARFDMSRVSRAPARFDPAELEALNRRVLQKLPFESVRPRLEALGLAGVDRSFWETVAPNLRRLDEAAMWWRICHDRLAPVIIDREVTEAAADTLPDGTLTDADWSRWIAVLRERTGRRGKALFRPLRLALTGRDDGPELRGLLALLGREKAVARLRGTTA